MRKTQSARPGVAAPERAMHDGAGNTSSCTSHFITGRENTQARIAEFLPRGEANAIPAQELAELIGAPSVRVLQTMIARESAETGALILSTVRGRGGYFLPADGAEGRREIERFIRTLTARASHTFARLKAARLALRQSAYQLKIDDAEQEASRQ